MNKLFIMINVVAGFGENENIKIATKSLNGIDDLNISLVNSEEELIDAFIDSKIHAVVRGSLKASKIMNYLKTLKTDSQINRATYINTFEEESFFGDYEFLLAPVGIDEGNSVDEKLELIVQAANFLQSLDKMPKIAILADGRKDDYGRSDVVDLSLSSSEELTQRVIDKFEDLENFDNDSYIKSKNYSIKNYFILLEKAIKEGNNIIIAPNGIFGNIIFRTLVLLNSWPSYGAVTLGIDEIFIDTSRDQSVEGYIRSLKLAYKLAKSKEI